MLPSEVGADDFRIPKDFRGRALGDLSAMMQADSAVRQSPEKAYLVIDDAQRGSVIAQVAQNRLEAAYLGLAEPGRGLVQEQELGLAHHGHRDPEHFFLAVGQAGGALIT